MDDARSNDENVEQSQQPNEDLETEGLEPNGSPRGNNAEEEDSARGTGDDFDWQVLEERFTKEMQQKEQQIKELRQEYDKLMSFYNVWAEIPTKHDPQRAAKRLKTRIAYVQAEEQRLEEKRQHQAKVIQAFQSALDLLDST